MILWVFHGQISSVFADMCVLGLVSPCLSSLCSSPNKSRVCEYENTSDKVFKEREKPPDSEPHMVHGDREADCETSRN